MRASWVVIGLASAIAVLPGTLAQQQDGIWARLLRAMGKIDQSGADGSHAGVAPVGQQERRDYTYPPYGYQPPPPPPPPGSSYEDVSTIWVDASTSEYGPESSEVYISYVTSSVYALSSTEVYESSSYTSTLSSSYPESTIPSASPSESPSSSRILLFESYVGPYEYCYFDVAACQFTVLEFFFEIGGGLFDYIYFAVSCIIWNHSQYIAILDIFVSVWFSAINKFYRKHLEWWLSSKLDSLFVRVQHFKLVYFRKVIWISNSCLGFDLNDTLYFELYPGDPAIFIIVSVNIAAGEPIVIDPAHRCRDICLSPKFDFIVKQLSHLWASHTLGKHSWNLDQDNVALGIWKQRSIDNTGQHIKLLDTVEFNRIAIVIRNTGTLLFSTNRKYLGELSCHPHTCVDFVAKFIDWATSTIHSSFFSASPGLHWFFKRFKYQSASVCSFVDFHFKQLAFFRHYRAFTILIISNQLNSFHTAICVHWFQFYHRRAFIIGSTCDKLINNAFEESINGTELEFNQRSSDPNFTVNANTIPAYQLNVPRFGFNFYSRHHRVDSAPIPSNELQHWVAELGGLYWLSHEFEWGTFWHEHSLIVLGIWLLLLSLELVWIHECRTDKCYHWDASIEFIGLCSNFDWLLQPEHQHTTS
ncbi:hypothetical protein B0H63DRAFT_443406 [Podospora didyma]|uniref:Uncharacterized protein n=1 Tax=Podospora didyma TaxID=330526 RepID=A0AAE0P455_9PEZI|nr:hypothetical protein B0H63DRAFT_443406 [Podospora didyma]